MTRGNTLTNRFLISSLGPGDSAAKVATDRLPTNTTTKNHPIHRWFNFIAGFSPEFVRQCIGALSIRGKGPLLDPFAGCATSLIVAC